MDTYFRIFFSIFLFSSKLKSMNRVMLVYCNHKMTSKTFLKLINTASILTKYNYVVRLMQFLKLSF